MLPARLLEETDSLRTVRSSRTWNQPLASRPQIAELLELAEELPDNPDGRHGLTLGNRGEWAARVAHDVELAVSHVPPGGTVVDVGGGYGLFALACARAGLRAILIDDFLDLEALGMLPRISQLCEREGVELRQMDVLRDPLDLEPNSVDAATCFHVLEHLPSSPKPLFEQMCTALRPSGFLVLAAPNAVNLRKRVAVALGRQGWSSLELWYDSERFRGHVREPIASDLFRICEDLGLVDPELTGTNFMGTTKSNRWVRRIARGLDPLLRRRPTLCSELYIAAAKPAEEGITPA